MKIVEASAGALTNLEVLDLLRSRGAGNDPTRAIATVSTSEFKRRLLLAIKQGMLSIRIVDECKKFDLAKAEILNIVNMRPTSEVELYTIVEGCELQQLRLGDVAEELMETIVQILPPHPSQKEESNEEAAEGEEETENPEPETADGEEETENPEPNTP